MESASRDNQIVRHGRPHQDSRPSEARGQITDGFKSMTRSMDARVQKPAQVNADSERVAVELQRNAAAVIEFEIQVTNRFVIDARVISVVAREISRARRNAAGCEAFAISASAAPAALRRAATEHSADHRLISPGRDVVSSN